MNGQGESTRKEEHCAFAYTNSIVTLCFCMGLGGWLPFLPFAENVSMGAGAVKGNDADFCIFLVKK